MWMVLKQETYERMFVLERATHVVKLYINSAPWLLTAVVENVKKKKITIVHFHKH